MICSGQAPVCMGCKHTACSHKRMESCLHEHLCGTFEINLSCNRRPQASQLLKSAGQLAAATQAGSQRPPQPPGSRERSSRDALPAHSPPGPPDTPTSPAAGMWWCCSHVPHAIC